MSTFLITTGIFIAITLGAAIAVIVLCLRAPLRNDLDDGDIGRLIFEEQRARAAPAEKAFSEGKKHGNRGRDRCTSPRETSTTSRLAN